MCSNDSNNRSFRYYKAVIDKVKLVLMLFVYSRPASVVSRMIAHSRENDKEL